MKWIYKTTYMLPFFAWHRYYFLLYSHSGFSRATTHIHLSNRNTRTFPGIKSIGNLKLYIEIQATRWFSVEPGVDRLSHTIAFYPQGKADSNRRPHYVRNPKPTSTRREMTQRYKALSVPLLNTHRNQSLLSSFFPEMCPSFLPSNSNITLNKLPRTVAHTLLVTSIF